MVPMEEGRMSNIPTVLTIKEVAAALRVSTSNVYLLVQSGALAPCIRIGRCWRIPESAVLKFIDQQSTQAA